MGLVELVLLAIGLAMDAFAVSICKGMASKRITSREGLLCGIWFGGFQGLMPFIGFLLGSTFVNVINKAAPWIAFVLLGFIGFNMIREAFSTEEESKPGFDVKTMLLMAVATSIDALAVGVTFVAVPVKVIDSSVLVNTLFGCAVIAAVTFVISFAGVRVGNIFGARFKSGSEAAGGFILIFIGLKVLLEHLGIIGFMSSADYLFGLLIPFAGTIMGSALVFLLNEIPESVKNILAGLSGGIMLSCAIWNLLSPNLMRGQVFVTCTGLLIGILFQYILDKTVPHTHVFTQIDEGPSTGLAHVWRVVLSETIHHVPEGIAVGAMYAGVMTSAKDVTLASAVAFAVGIAIQNIPEGAFVSSPLTLKGERRGKSFLMGVISGVVEPVLGIAAIIIVNLFPSSLSFIMSLAGGAILFLVIEETIPSMSAENHSDKGTLAFAVFFVLMMILTYLAGGFGV